jgi:hypothetical protein
MTTTATTSSLTTKTTPTNLLRLSRPSAKTTSYKQETKELTEAYNEMQTLLKTVEIVISIWERLIIENLNKTILQNLQTEMLPQYVRREKEADEKISLLIERHVQVLNNRTPIVIPPEIAKVFYKANPSCTKGVARSLKEAFGSDIKTIREQHEKLIGIKENLRKAFSTLKELLSSSETKNDRLRKDHSNLQQQVSCLRK